MDNLCTQKCNKNTSLSIVMINKFIGGIDMETKEKVQELSDFIFFLNQALDT